MPELAEVEYYRKQWNPGLHHKVSRVELHAGKRVLRGVNTAAMVKALTGATLFESEAHAKQMLFRFSGGNWLGVHLGMTGKLSVESAGYLPGAHDHLVLFQEQQALVFTDPRQFGLLRWDTGAVAPQWWRDLPPAIISPEFTLELVRDFLRHHPRLALKSVLLMQERFPGVGNWMADEILWRAKFSPHRVCGALTSAESKTLCQETRAVCKGALESVAVDFTDPPKDWFFHVRWSPKGRCPRDNEPLQTDTVGGRTTRWCKRCQG